MDNSNKVLLLGDVGVGKTNLKKRYFGNLVNEKEVSGCIVSTKQLANGQVIEIWDPSDERLDSSEETKTRFYSNPLAALLMYDVSKPESFQNIPNWISELLAHNQNRRVPLLLIASKSDLRGSQESIPLSSGYEYAEAVSKWAEMKVPHVELTVLKDQGYDKILKFLTNLEYYTTFFNEYEAEDRDRIFLADRLYHKVTEDNTKDLDYLEYFDYIKTHGKELKEYLRQKMSETSS